MCEISPPRVNCIVRRHHQTIPSEHGWEGVVDGQHLHRTALEELQIREDHYLKEYATLEELEAGIRQWIELYNTWRPHQALGNKTPALAHLLQFEKRKS